MVAIAIATQKRILDAVGRHFGTASDDLVRDLCNQRLGAPFERLEFHQLGNLIKALDNEAGTMLARRADLLADDILKIQQDIVAGMPGRLIVSVSRLLGPSAEPFMRTACSRMNIILETLEKKHLGEVAKIAAADAKPVFGEETAEALGNAIERAAFVRPATMVAALVDAAKQHMGARGEAFLRDLARQKMEIELDDIDPEALPMLANKVRASGADIVQTAAGPGLTQAIAAAIVSPNVSLRAKLIDTARKFVGPAAENFLKQSTRKAGMPWDAIDLEHMMWLAEVVRAEATPLIGKKQADAFAHIVRGYLTGK